MGSSPAVIHYRREEKQGVNCNFNSMDFFVEVFLVEGSKKPGFQGIEGECQRGRSEWLTQSPAVEGER